MDSKMIVMKDLAARSHNDILRMETELHDFGQHLLKRSSNQTNY